MGAADFSVACACFTVLPCMRSRLCGYMQAPSVFFLKKNVITSSWAGIPSLRWKWRLWRAFRQARRVHSVELR